MKRLRRALAAGYPLLKFVFRPLAGLNPALDAAAVLAQVLAVGIPATFSTWVRSDWRWLAGIGWVILALLLIATVRLYFRLNPCRGVTLTPLPPDQPEGWPVPFLDDWPHHGEQSRRAYRLTAEVRNKGQRRRLQAVAVPPMEGAFVDPSYGDFFLQWDLEPGETFTLFRTKQWKLHIAAAGNGGVAFLGPPRRSPLYRLLGPLDALRFTVELRDVDSETVWTIPLEITFPDPESGNPQFSFWAKGTES